MRLAEICAKVTATERSTLFATGRRGPCKSRVPARTFGQFALSDECGIVLIGEGNDRQREWRDPYVYWGLLLISPIFFGTKVALTRCFCRLKRYRALAVENLHFRAKSRVFDGLVSTKHS
jgi:hypothetical protein